LLHQDNWSCPWCEHTAAPDASQTTISEARYCPCGAIGLGAPAHDFSEVIDDAVGMFGIADGFLTPHDSDRIRGLHKSGVEIRPGIDLAPDDQFPLGLEVMWFRPANLIAE